MRKYGVENFTIEEIEKTDNPEDRERYWIEYFSSFKNGYNATIGGDGRPYIDYDLVVATYKELKIKQLVADKLNIHVSTVSKILKERNIDNIYTNKEAMQVIKGKIVNQYTLDGEFIRSFPSYSEAARSLGKITSTSKGASAHISEACKGKRKTAYGFIWKSE